jgi:hypothetical protein
MPAAERRRYALTGPPPPDWFTEMRPPPWIDDHVISEGRKLAGVSLVRLPVPVPPGQQVYVPAQRQPDVLPDVPAPDTPARPVADPGPAGRHRALDAQDGQSVTSTGGAGRHRAPRLGQDTAGDGGREETVIVGIAAAARYLCYDKPDSFRRACTRHPIPGESRTGDGRPCWTPRCCGAGKQTKDRRQPKLMSTSP